MTEKCSFYVEVHSAVDYSADICLITLESNAKMDNGPYLLNNYDFEVANSFLSEDFKGKFRLILTRRLVLVGLHRKESVSIT